MLSHGFATTLSPTLWHPSFRSTLGSGGVLRLVFTAVVVFVQCVLIFKLQAKAAHVQKPAAIVVSTLL
jgi:hypothetical protein